MMTSRTLLSRKDTHDEQCEVLYSLLESDWEAIKAKRLVGRYVIVPTQHGNAFYQIVIGGLPHKEFVIIHQPVTCYVDPILGKRARVGQEFLEQRISIQEDGQRTVRLINVDKISRHIEMPGVCSAYYKDKLMHQRGINLEY